MMLKCFVKELLTTYISGPERRRPKGSADLILCALFSLLAKATTDCAKALAGGGGTTPHPITS
jgi:hypothetical protein